MLDALDAAPEGLPIREIESKVNVSNERVKKTTQLLALESPAPIATFGMKWQLTAARLSEAFWQRTERLTELSRAEQQQMQQHVDLSSDHMAYTIRSLDGDPGDFLPPEVPELPTTVHPASVRDAIAFRRHASLPIEPRKQWPTGRWIERNHRAQQGKYRDDRFPDELVDTCAALAQEWQPVPYPTWVSAVIDETRLRQLLQV